jgi:hypothetical protein
MVSTVDRVIAVTNRFLENRGHPDDSFVAVAQSAVCQDAYIFGVDVDDYVAELENEFGQVVWIIPWLRFTDQTSSFRGWRCLAFPFWFLFRLLRLPFRTGPVIPKSDPRNFGPRLELDHIAKIIEQGEWVEP